MFENQPVRSGAERGIMELLVGLFAVLLWLCVLVGLVKLVKWVWNTGFWQVLRTLVLSILVILFTVVGAGFLFRSLQIIEQFNQGL